MQYYYNIGIVFFDKLTISYREVYNEDMEDFIMNEGINELANNLESNINMASKVFITGHNNPDYDAIGSAFGLATIVKFLGKEAYVIVNDDPANLDVGVRKILQANKDNYNIINLVEARNILDDKSLLITTDVNKKYMVSVKDDLDKFGRVVIVDHHMDDEFTIPANYKYIDVKSSSASEIITRVLKLKGIDYSPMLASALMAGVMLDTKRFEKNTSESTFMVAAELMKNGADYKSVKNLFISDFKEATEVNSLIFGKSDNDGLLENNTVKMNYLDFVVSFTVNRENVEKKYNQITLAKAADQMLNYDVDASIVLGYTSNDDVGISARSRGDFNVGEVLGKLQYLNLPHIKLLAFEPAEYIKSGGGNAQNAGGKVTTTDILELEKIIKELVKNYLDENFKENNNIKKKGF